MDRHRVIRNLSECRKLAATASRGTKRIYRPTRKYATLVPTPVNNEPEEEFTLEGFQKRKYIKLYSKAD